MAQETHDIRVGSNPKGRTKDPKTAIHTPDEGLVSPWPVLLLVYERIDMRILETILRDLAKARQERDQMARTVGLLEREYDDAVAKIQGESK